MPRTETEIVACVADTGQWFEQGLRVECTPPAGDRRSGRIVKAALGAYEVLSCRREEADGGRWLTVRLRPFAQP